MQFSEIQRGNKQVLSAMRLLVSQGAGPLVQSGRVRIDGSCVSVNRKLNVSRGLSWSEP